MKRKDFFNNIVALILVPIILLMGAIFIKMTQNSYKDTVHKCEQFLKGD